MVGAVGAEHLSVPLPWLAEPLREALEVHRAHALLVHGPNGVGQFELATTLAQAWLCEAARANAGQGVEAGSGTAPARPCGACASCRLLQARSHPDLLVLLPEALREPLGWAAGGAEGDDAGAGKAGEKASKAKPSKEIRVEAVRAAVAFAQTTSARGFGKVVVIHPAERMNGISANTLLKTLEEPPGDARFVLCTGAPDALLPTIRSRCQALRLALPPQPQAVAWMAVHGVAHPDVLLAAAGGQPLEALDWARQGVDAALWARLPGAVTRGDASAFSGWPLPRLVDALQKLCHDAMCAACGAAPRYFSAGQALAAADLKALSEWAVELRRAARHAEHPWGPALMAESLVQQGRRALQPRTSSARGAPRAAAPSAGVHSLHSAP